MISFQNRIDNKYFSRPIFSVTLTKNILILRNSGSTINFEFRSFKIGLNFCSQSRIISTKWFFNNK